MRLPRLRIFYFEEDKSPLVLGAIKAIVERYRHEYSASDIWIRSHWRQGPHVNLVGNMSDAAFDDRVVPIARDILGEWLALEPSSTRLDPDQYAALSKRLAVFELEQEPLAPIGENNTFERSEYVPNLDLYGVEQIALAHAKYNALSLDIIFELLRVKQSDTNDFYVSLIELMALTGNLVRKHGLRRSFMSYRSHAEYFFANHDPTGRFRARLDAGQGDLFTRADTAVRNADIVFNDSAAVAELFPRWAAWYYSMQSLAERVYAISEENASILGKYNRLESFAAGIVDQLSVTLDPGKERKESEFELYMGDMGQVFAQVSHIAFRSMVNFFYGLLPILSVSPVQKFALCHFLASSCERVFDKSWRDVVDEGRDGSAA